MRMVVVAAHTAGWIWFRFFNHLSELVWFEARPASATTTRAGIHLNVHETRNVVAFPAALTVTPARHMARERSSIVDGCVYSMRPCHTMKMTKAMSFTFQLKIIAKIISNDNKTKLTTQAARHQQRQQVKCGAVGRTMMMIAAGRSSTG